MTHKIPENAVEIRSNDSGGVDILLDGYDLAPHSKGWQIDQDDPSGELTLTVQIPCSRIVMDVAERLGRDGAATGDAVVEKVTAGGTSYLGGVLR